MPHQVNTRNLVASWEAPVQGVIRNIPPHRLPEDALYEAKNVVYRDGYLVKRSGLVEFIAAGVLARPMGLISIPSLGGPAFQSDAFQEDTFQMGTDGEILVAVTTQKILAYYGGVWNDLIQTPASEALTGGASDPARIATMEVEDDEQGSGVLIMVVNGFDIPRFWNLQDRYSTVGTGWPTFSDVTVVADRFVGVAPPYKIQWGEVFSKAAPSALNVRILADTTDKVVAIRRLGITGCAVFKEETLWTGTIQGGPSSQVFRWDYRGNYDGPAGPSAIEDVNGTLYYMTATGRIGSFNSITHKWLVDGAWPQVRDGSASFPAFDVQYANRVFTMQHPFHNEVWFFYPQVGDGGDLHGVLILTIPDPSQGEQRHAGFPGRLSIPVSAATHRHGVNQDALVAMSSTDFRVLKATDNASDLGSSFSGYWRHGLVGVQGLVPYRLDAHESFFSRNTGYGTLTTKVVTSNKLDKVGGTASATATTIDLTNDTAVLDEKGDDIRARFFGMLYEFTSAARPEFMGTRLSAHNTENAPKDTHG